MYTTTLSQQAETVLARASGSKLRLTVACGDYEVLPVDQFNELAHRQSGLSNDAAQSSATQIVGVYRDGHLAGRVGRMNQATVTSGSPRNNKPSSFKSTNDLSRSKRWQPLNHAASVTVTW